jgi:hypothetical protein
MTYEQAAEILELHNRWRRGADIPMVAPALLGQAIELAVEALYMVAE